LKLGPNRHEVEFIEFMQIRFAGTVVLPCNFACDPRSPHEQSRKFGKWHQRVSVGARMACGTTCCMQLGVKVRVKVTHVNIPSHVTVSSRGKMCVMVIAAWH